MDRPLPASKTQGAEHKTKEFVQPQYLVDAVNNLLLLPTRPYKPGVAAPPHLSPFVDNEAAGYIPDRQREINTLAGVATPAAVQESESEDESGEEEAEKDQDMKADHKGDADSSSDDNADESEEDEPKPK